VGALDDVVVLELSDGVAGGYAGKLLADLGAQVLKWEPPTGDSLRALGPFPGDEADPDRSGMFAFLHAGKLGVSFEMSEGTARLRQLAAHADIVIDALGPGRLESLGLTYAELSASNPSLVLVSVTPFGRYGPRRDMLTSEIVEYAMGGYMYFGGDPNREPLALPCHQVELHAGTHAALIGLAAMLHARATGEGQEVDLSRQEAMLSAHSWLTTMWTHEGQVQRRTGSVIVPCSDGFVYLMTLVPYQNLFVMMERFDVLEDEELFNPLVWWEKFIPYVLPMFMEWAKDKKKMDVYHQAQELRVAVSPVMNAQDLLESQQLAARDWFIDLPLPDGSTFKAPGFPYKLSETPGAVRAPAPRIGQHTQAVQAADFAWANSGVQRGAGRSWEPPLALPVDRYGKPPSKCLEGLRVIEVTANWAGPMAGRHLADLGAEVLKVELPRKPATRALHYQGGEMWKYHYHRAAYYNKLNRSKLDIGLDASTPDGRELFLKLAQRADVLIENNSARVMGNLRIGYKDLAEVNPRLIFCSMSGMGSYGPEKDYSAYGSNVETLSGLASMLGYGPGEYYGTGSFYADPVTGNHGTVAILAALNWRRISGKGQYIDMALQEAAIPYFAEAVLDYTLNGRVREPMANRSPRFAPQGAYRSLGSDCWLALACETDEQWRSLCDVILSEAKDLSLPPRVNSAEQLTALNLDQRRQLHDEIDRLISAWSAEYDHNEATRILQAAGVPAGPVMANWEIVQDTHLFERDFWVHVPHPEAGVEQFPGIPWKLSKTPGTVWRYAPLFAEDNDLVFKQWLGLSDAEVEALVASEAVSYEPKFAGGGIL
jgi:crotonobetainyl-CoA:carnitine CoA-transferase CaiB-like acyl-CoA transferase